MNAPDQGHLVGSSLSIFWASRLGKSSRRIMRSWNVNDQNKTSNFLDIIQSLGFQRDTKPKTYPDPALQLTK